ncbi:MAG: Flp family type IVb pilin [Rhodobacteraceae bacterium]|nr:Flp family type IVb pilin [Paracoccaceae bacterium]
MRRGQSSKRSWTRFSADQRGATAIEYAMITALLSLGVLLGVESIGDGVVGQWTATILPAIGTATGG